MEVDKRGLCAFDNKRFILDNGIDTLAYGHKSITANVQDAEGDAHDHDRVLTMREARRQGIVRSYLPGFLAVGQDPRVTDQSLVRFNQDDDAAQPARKRNAAAAQLDNMSSTSATNSTTSTSTSSSASPPLLDFLDLQILDTDSE